MDEAKDDIIQTLKSNTNDLIETLLKKRYKQAMVKIKDHVHHFTKKNNVNFHKVALACEVYFYTVIHDILFAHICSKTMCKDVQINSKLLTVLPLKSPDLKPELEKTLQGSKANIVMMSYLTNPRAKLDALDKLLSLASMATSNPVSTDDLLPWLIQALGHGHIHTWYAQLEFMSNFKLVDQLSQQDLFNLATLEAALEHLRTLTLDSSEDILWSTSNKKLNHVFQAIEKGDLNEVKCLLEQSLLPKCHPLCDCEKCDNIENLLIAKDDGNYLTPLMLASWLGKPLIVEYLLMVSNNFKKYDLLEDVDKSGRTALHLAAYNGHQNALLLLLNAKSNVDTRDTQGNTALHLW